MKHVTIIQLLLLVSFQLGHSLKCYTCTEDICTVSTCYSGQACGTTIMGSATMKSCLPNQVCGTTVGSIRNYCCSTDFCNSAAGSAGVSFVTVAVCLVVLWVTKL
ncbi:toxin 3FTx-Lei1-like [Pelobates fuscus]|uniref:toxin 3FTx-Lei1-like n=1 Tax=Pelobates fuscus TaxID=191477 RepID=UPI002FE4EA07